MKIKRVIAAVLSLCMVSGAVSFNAPMVRDFSITADAADEEVITYGLWSYTKNDDGSINIVDCRSTDEEIVFPATLDGKKVWSIRMVNYQNPSYKDTIKSAVISEGIETVGYYAFSNCIHLQTVSLPDSVKSIGVGAFLCCFLLKEITIPKSVTAIHFQAFQSCHKLTSVTIPENVTTIGNSAFENCSNLTDITILNPKCACAGDKDTFSDPSHCTIHGYKGSTAEEFATKWGYEFEALDNDDFITITDQSEDVYFQPGDETVHLSVKAESFYDKPLSYSWSLYLPDKKKWYEIQSTDSGEFDMPSFYAGGWTKDEDGAKVYCEVISGNTTKAAELITLHFVDEGSIQITQQPPKTVYFETYEPAKITMPAAVGNELTYSWYFKTPDRTTFLLDEEFEADEWTGSYDFYGLTGGNGLTDKYDGTEMYCKIWNKQGAEVETKHFTLKKYQGDVDRNITIRMPEVGETYAHYMADVSSIVPAELIIGDDYFGIIPKDASGNYIPSVRAMNYDDVFKAGQRYEFCLKMYLPEYVSPTAIYQFYGKGLIVNGEEHGAADTLDEEELYFWDYWTTPVLEGGLLEGDVNADGESNISDVVLMQKWLLAVPDTDLVDWKAGDLCEDDKLNVFDLCQMREMLIK